MISTILFDLDGTLVDSKESMICCIKLVLEQFDKSLPNIDQLEWCVGPPIRDVFSQLLNTKDDNLVEQALKNYRKYFSDMKGLGLAVYPDVFKTLRRLKKRRIRIYLATSKPILIAKDILDRLNLTLYFDAVYGSELNGQFSDKKELISRIINSEGLNHRSTLIIGDRSFDIIAGKYNKIITAAVTYGYGTIKEINASHPNYIFDNLSDFATFIELRTKSYYTNKSMI